jgi:hypothetical protein
VSVVGEQAKKGVDDGKCLFVLLTTSTTSPREGIKEIKIASPRPRRAQNEISSSGEQGEKVVAPSPGSSVYFGLHKTPELNMKFNTFYSLSTYLMRSKHGTRICDET